MHLFIAHGFLLTPYCDILTITTTIHCGILECVLVSTLKYGMVGGKVESVAMARVKIGRILVKVSWVNRRLCQDGKEMLKN